MSEMIFSPGISVRIREAEWFVRRVAPGGAIAVAYNAAMGVLNYQLQPAYHARTITYKVPFFRKDREADCKEVWELLEIRA